MQTLTHKILDGEVTLYKQPLSKNWFCRFYVKRQRYATTTKTDDLPAAKEAAKQFFFNTQVKIKNGFAAPTSASDSFKHHARLALKQYEKDAERGNRSKAYVRELAITINKLITIIGNVSIHNIDNRTWLTVRDKLLEEKPHLKEGTLHQYKTGIQVVMSQCVSRGDIKEDKAPKFKKDAAKPKEATPRTYFPRAEYNELLKALAQNIAEKKGTRWHKAAQELNDFVIFGVNTGMRIGEQRNVRFMDISIIPEYHQSDNEMSEVLYIENILGKRTRQGVCKSFFNAVEPFKRCVERAGLTMENYKQSDKMIFSEYHRDMFREILVANKLRFTNSRPPLKRDLKSLRSTYICFALEQHVDVFAIANNCRTSVAVIESNYAKHFRIKDSVSLNKRAYK